MNFAFPWEGYDIRDSLIKSFDRAPKARDVRAWANGPG